MRMLLFLWLLATLAGCQKNDSFGCNEIPAPILSVNTQVEAGGTINLSVKDMVGSLYYKWTGPNGFTSDQQNPELRQVQSNHAGRYKLEVGFMGGCVKTATSDSVVVSVPPAPCTPKSNSVSIEGVSYNQFYSVTGWPEGGSYFISANGMAGDLELEFAGYARPATGVYNIRPHSGEWRPGDVHLSASSQNSRWLPATGKVYVTLTGNKVTATFCNVEVISETFGTKSTMSGSVTEE